MNPLLCRFSLMVLLTLAGLDAHAADKLIVNIGNQNISAWRTADLESARQEATAAHKPIAWIASAPKLLNGKGSISDANQRGATLHAFFALRTKAVLVFMDAYEENHKVLPIVDKALHTPDPHYNPPTVLLLDPAASQILATVLYEPDFTKRANALARALDQIKEKF
jgi:hypothetical protein